MEIFIIILLTLLNGVFSMSEISLVSSRKFKLENSAKRGHKGAQKALELLESPNQFFSTVQIGITLIGILLGIYSGDKLTSDFKGFIERFEILKPYSQPIAVGSVLLFITYLSIILGELLPKRIGLSFPETISSTVSRPMYFLSKLTAPFVWLLTKTNDILLKILGIDSRTDGIVTEEEIKSIISESTESGEIQEIEQEIVERVFAMGDRKVGALMTHRSDLLWFDIRDNLDNIKEKARKELHTVYPVADGDINDIKGVVSLQELFIHEGKDFSLEKYLKEPLFIPESSSAYKVLEMFKTKRFHYGIVVDEYGTVMGVITMDDLIDALLGDASQDFQTEYQIIQKDENTWTMDSQYPFHEFLDYFEREPDEDAEISYNTVGGFITAELQHLPKKGDYISWKGLKITVTDADARRIKSIEIIKE